MRRARAGRTEPCCWWPSARPPGAGAWGAAGPARTAHSLTFSLGLPLAPADWSGLSLAVGVSLAESLHPAHRASNGPTTCGWTTASSAAS